MTLKRGQIKFVKKYTVEEVENDPTRVYVYGDNLVHRGQKGQAVIRKLDNSLGVPTKRYPCVKGKSCFFSDKIDEVLAVKKALEQIEHLVKKGKKIALPKDGLGTGLAELEKRSPVIFKYITLFIRRLDNRYLRFTRR